jgi:hypothetical protein
MKLRFLKIDLRLGGAGVNQAAGRQLAIADVDSRQWAILIISQQDFTACYGDSFTYFYSFLLKADETYGP